jgi:hypothetical protein
MDIFIKTRTATYGIAIILMEPRGVFRGWVE